MYFSGSTCDAHRRWMRILLCSALMAALLTLTALGSAEYWVVAASYMEEAPALQLAKEVGESSGRQWSVAEALVNGVRYYRAMIGPFGSRTEADSARDEVRTAGWKDAWVLSLTVQDPPSDGLKPEEGQPLRHGEVKVGLSWVSGMSLLLGTDGTITVTGALPDGTSDASFTSGIIVRLEAEGGNIRARATEGHEGPLFASPVTVSSSVGILWVSDSYKIYGGRIEVAIDQGKGGLIAADIIDVEDYLLSVLPSEIGGNAPLEAYKAQAVVARTEALSSAGRHADKGWDLCDSTHCQVFKGMYGQSPNPDIMRAVRETAGEVLISIRNGAMAETASFHSACGGITESSEGIWGSGLEHLTSIRDRVSGGAVPDLRDEEALSDYIESEDRADLCYKAYGYRWSAEVRATDLAARITEAVVSGSALPTGIPTEMKVPKVTQRTQRGAAVELYVPHEGHEYIIKGELNIRKLLGGATVIKSGVFILRAASGSGVIKISGAGYGHGVGMCQEGAKALARIGKDYRSILAFYYKGSAVETN